MSSITVPTLLIAAERDTLCPAKYIKQAKEKIQNAELLFLPDVGHFDVYVGKELDTVLSAQVDFFKKYL